MWLFCKTGFFSAVIDRDNGKQVLVRSRFEGDLERLLKNTNGVHDIQHTPEADYPFRVFVRKAVWECLVLAEAEDMDYDNFKNAAHDGTERDGAYMAVWIAMRRAQDLTRRP
jgi:hypothetical protein